MPAWLDLVRPYLNAILIGFVGFLLAFVVAQILGRVLEAPMGKAWSRFLGNLFGLAIAGYTIKLVLDTTGAAGAIVVLATVITGALAFGSERLAGDLVSGLILFVSKPYEVGQYVLLSGHDGQVTNISLTTTMLTDLAGDKIIIHNSDIVGDTIVNRSAQTGQLISVKVPVPVGQDLDVAVTVVMEALRDFSPEMNALNYQPSVVCEDMTFSYTIMVVRAYVSERLDYGPEKTRMFLTAVRALKAAGINLTR